MEQRRGIKRKIINSELTKIDVNKRITIHSFEKNLKIRKIYIPLIDEGSHKKRNYTCETFIKP